MVSYRCDGVLQTKQKSIKWKCERTRTKRHWIHHSWKSVDKPNTNWCDCIGCGTVFVRSMRICETFIHSCFCKIPSKCLCLMSYFMCICAVSVTIARTTDVLLYCMMLFSLAINRTHSTRERSNIQTPFNSLVALQCGKLVNIVESILYYTNSCSQLVFFRKFSVNFRFTITLFFFFKNNLFATFAFCSVQIFPMA